jgi:hypothetical protein
MEWQEQARKDEQRRIVSRVLRVRFRRPIPKALMAAIRNLTDDEELDHWLCTAATAASLEAFRTAVGH